MEFAADQNQQCTKLISDLAGEIPDHIIAELERIEPETLPMSEVASIEYILNDLMKLDDALLDALATQIAADFDVAKYTNCDEKSSCDYEGNDSFVGVHANEPQTIVNQIECTTELIGQVTEAEPAMETTRIMAPAKGSNQSEREQLEQPEKNGDELNEILKINPLEMFGFDNESNGMNDGKQGVECISSNPITMMKKEGRTKYYSGTYKRQITDRDHLRNSLQHERGINSGERQSHKCKLCAKPFRRERDLATHLLKHTGKQQFPPTGYGSMKHFDSRGSSAKEQSRAHHSDANKGEKLRECKVCKKSFQHEYLLKEHFRIHSGEKPFKCEKCSQRFTRKSILKMHQAVHSGGKPFQCEVCSQSFACKRYLWAHVRVHSGEKPYQCEVCKKSFRTTAYLRIHSRIHTGEKLFKCEICCRTFAWKLCLQEHQTVHSGERPYQCRVCEKSYAHKSCLWRHSKIHSDMKQETQVQRERHSKVHRSNNVN